MELRAQRVELDNKLVVSLYDFLRGVALFFVFDQCLNRKLQVCCFCNFLLSLLFCFLTWLPRLLLNELAQLFVVHLVVNYVILQFGNWARLWDQVFFVLNV